jgi:4-hydroxy-4-methyl-2-oxoglutarate aldolase
MRTTTTLAAALESLREYDTALVANTIGYVDPTPAHEYYMAGYIQSVTPTLGPTVGVAVTCEMDTSTPGNAPEFDGYLRQLEQMQRTEEPVVWVVKTTGSRPDHECVLGDGMGKDLYSVGCVGAVTDGGVRDIAGLMTVPFAVYSRGKTIHHCALRVRSINQPIEIGGITVRPGDVIHANGEGVIKIPAGCVETIGAGCKQMRLFEYEAHEALRSAAFSPLEKRKIVGRLLRKFGFAH